MKVYVVRNPNNPVNIDGMYTSKARAETHAKNENKIFWNGNEVLIVEEINVATNKKSILFKIITATNLVDDGDIGYLVD